MKKLAFVGACALTLAACGQNPTTGAATLTTTLPVPASKVRTYVAEGQLLCDGGPAALAMFAPSGAAILAKGAAKEAVNKVCGLIDSVTVSPSDAPIGTMTVTLPPTLSIPLKS